MYYQIILFYFDTFQARKSPTKDGRQERNEIDSDSMGTIEALIKGKSY